MVLERRGVQSAFKVGVRGDNHIFLDPDPWVSLCNETHIEEKQAWVGGVSLLPALKHIGSKMVYWGENEPYYFLPSCPGKKANVWDKEEW
jgi:hypothetical protein